MDAGVIASVFVCCLLFAVLVAVCCLLGIVSCVLFIAVVGVLVLSV